MEPSGAEQEAMYQSLIELISDDDTEIAVIPITMYQSLIELISDVTVREYPMTR